MKYAAAALVTSTEIAANRRRKSCERGALYLVFLVKGRRGSLNIELALRARIELDLD